MFILDMLDEEYIERRIEWLEAQKPTPTPINDRLEQNGVFVSLPRIASYWGLPLREALMVLDISRVHPFINAKKPLYFRPHLWQAYDDYCLFMSKRHPQHIRLQHTLVSSDDVAVFYELSRSNATRVLKNLKLPVFKNHSSSRISLFDYNSVVAAEARNKSFSKVTFYSGQSCKGSVSTGAFVFRDIDCPRYDACMEFTYNTSNHMNCCVCKHHIHRTKSKDTPVDDVAVYTPRNHAGVVRLQKGIATKLGGDLSLLPNAI